MGAGTACSRVPLGPLTVTSAPLMVTSTPAGTGTGSLPIRDMAYLLSGLPDVGEDFAADALGLCLLVGEEAGGRGQDRHAEAAQDLGQVGGLAVLAQAGLRHAAKTGDGTLTAGAVLERDGEVLAHLRVLHGPACDVALGLQDRGDTNLQLRRRHGDRVVVRRVRVAQTRQHVCDG